ncbi:MAG: GAF domain-containing protein [bacterium]|nr:GAF domain-containing protein [bacterium]
MKRLLLVGKTPLMAFFWGLIAFCMILAVACVHLALSELGQPWGGFAFSPYGQVMKAYDSGLVFFDTILSVNGRLLDDPHHIGANLRDVIHRTPAGTSLTYRVRRGARVHTVMAPVQRTTRGRLAVEFGLPLLVALGQLSLGAIVFLLRPNTLQSRVFLGACLAWFGLFVTFFDFQSTYVFHELFLFSWYMTSALFVHLAFVFPEERQIIRRHPRMQYLFYVPSLGLWGIEQVLDIFVRDFYHHAKIGFYLTQVHTVYWGATLLFLLASLAYTTVRASSPVARRRALTVFFGFAAGFLIPVGGESAALLFRLNLPLEFAWVLTLFLPLSITYAILRYNLFDVGVIVRRTLTYSVLTGIVIGGYVLLIWVFNTLLHGIPIAQSRGFPVLFGLAVLFGLNPLRVRIQDVLDRLFFRTRYDFRQTIEALSRDLTALLDLDEITQRIVNTIMSALNVSSVALYLDDGSGIYCPIQVVGDQQNRLASIHPQRSNSVVDLIARQQRGVSRYDLEANPQLAQDAPRARLEFERLGVSLALPLLFKGDLIGVLALGEKQSGAIFTEADLELLRTLTNQSAIAIANARAYRSLETTNVELSAALRKVELLENVKTHLGKFVPTSVRQIIERDPTAPALDKHDQDVTVLFLDIEGYTRMSEALDQAKVNYIVEHYFSSFLDDIYANHGDINETAGDGLMIIFQDENPVQHARAAARTALAVRDKTRRINAELEGTYAPITVNMGLNSGTAAVGSTKFEGARGTRWTFTASGPITNLAARIGASATGGTIYVGAATAQRLSDDFELQGRGRQSFKNVREPVDVYEILGQRALAETVHP